MGSCHWTRCKRLMSDRVQSTRSRWSWFHFMSRIRHLTNLLHLFESDYISLFYLWSSKVLSFRAWPSKSAVMKSLTDDDLLSWTGPKIESQDEGQLSTNHMICILINYFATLFNLSTKWNKLKSGQRRYFLLPKVSDRNHQYSRTRDIRKPVRIGNRGTTEINVENDQNFSGFGISWLWWYSWDPRSSISKTLLWL